MLRISKTILQLWGRPAWRWRSCAVIDLSEVHFTCYLFYSSFPEDWGEDKWTAASQPLCKESIKWQPWHALVHPNHFGKQLLPKITTEAFLPPLIRKRGVTRRKYWLRSVGTGLTQHSTLSACSWTCLALIHLLCVLCIGIYYMDSICAAGPAHQFTPSTLSNQGFAQMDIWQCH